MQAGRESVCRDGRTSHIWLGLAVPYFIFTVCRWSELFAYSDEIYQYDTVVLPKTRGGVLLCARCRKLGWNEKAKADRSRGLI